MGSIVDIAMQFFDACETGGGWQACKAHRHPDASFASQADPLADIGTVEAYAEWMKGLLLIIPDGRYELKSFAVDQERNCVMAYARFLGTQTGEGGPVPPTSKSVCSDYVYVMDFEGDRIRHMTKIWNAAWARRQLGWL